MATVDKYMIATVTMYHNERATVISFIPEMKF